ncbi:WhiB family transcriptional regulator [Mycobacterium kansasii]
MTENLTGLCKFSDPDTWFVFEHTHKAKGICGNCPVRLACAKAALDLGATDGIWAGVRLPGIRIMDDLYAAYDELRCVIAGMQYEPESHRARTLAIREAVEYAASLEKVSA